MCLLFLAIQEAHPILQYVNVIHHEWSTKSEGVCKQEWVKSVYSQLTTLVC